MPMPREKVFLSYSHRDREWLERLLEHLAVLERWGLIHSWSDNRIAAGADWQGEIEEALGQSKVAVLLISPAFLASQYIWDREWPRIQAHKAQGMEILPLVVRACAWRLDHDLREMQVRPTDGRPLAIGNEAQIDLDLSAFVYELATVVQQFPGDRATQEQELADQFRAVAGGAVPRYGGVQQDPTRPGERIRPEVVPQRLPQSWTGVYNNDYQFQLSIDSLTGKQFVGRIRYLGTETVTRVEGRFLDAASEVAADLGLPGEQGQHPQGAPVAAVLQETEYEKEGARPVRLDGQYRAIVYNRSIIGAWFADGRLVARFTLEPDALPGVASAIASAVRHPL
jgi:TIR domain